ncbi:MAG TPA: excinuclease ABC subunit C, partial [Flammeovirgaceae bacterium]|nr:excinuclease ABC subunit C [Flammeovirgaceae bacterium]
TLLSNYSIAGMPENITVVVPKIGDKRKLVEMSLKNAYNLKKQHKSKPEAAKTKQLYALEQLQKDLSLTTLPEHIECFDNSNLQGSQPVASMVCFKNGVPSKHDYRKFNIKTVSGPDDFASMQEIVTRRYRRLLAEEGDLPDLIVIDGGKGQLNAAVKALKELDIYGQIPLIGIAKKLEEIYLPDDPLPLHISKKSSSLKLLQRIRDEAHRFAITFHRQKRSSTITTKLQELPGIGTHTADKLLAAFRSVKKIKQASQEELARVVGKTRAAIIVQAIKKGSI